MEQNKQGTMEWHRQRLGNVTSSQIWKIMTEPKSKSEEWSTTAYSYLMERVGERMTGEPITGFTTAAMQWGIDHEPLARRWVERHYDCVITESVYVPHETITHYGGSADGVWTATRDFGLVKAGDKIILEVKCPTSAEHLKNIRYSKDVATLKAKYPELYWQKQSNMELNKAQWSLFCSFDPRIDMACGMHTFLMAKDEADCASMLIKAQKATAFIDAECEFFEGFASAKLTIHDPEFTNAVIIDKI